ncbi:MAG: hypothetical protein AAGA48_37720 [Myxococcota bacterium]
MRRSNPIEALAGSPETLVPLDRGVRVPDAEVQHSEVPQRVVRVVHLTASLSKERGRQLHEPKVAEVEDAGSLSFLGLDAFLGAGERGLSVGVEGLHRHKAYRSSHLARRLRL